MDWDDVRLFLAIAEAGSFTGAAETLGQHQSTVSRRVRGLEQSLGGALFQRSARSFVLTPLAQRLRPEAEAVAASVERFRRRAADPDRPQGLVRLATAEELASELLVPALGRLWSVAPDIELVLDGRTEVVPVGPGEAEVALRVTRPTQSSLRLRKVGSIRYGVYAHEEHGFGEHPADWPWLVLDDAHGRIPETRWLRSFVDRPLLRLRSRDTRDLARAAAEGWGVAVLPTPLAERHGLLELRTTELVRPLWLVTHEALANVARVRMVLDWVAAVCARVQGR